MKYVRTQDGRIHRFLGKYKDEFGFYYLKMNKDDCCRCDSDYYKNCKEADTIKELCDEFVVEADELGINKHYSHSINETLKDAKRSAEIYKQNYNKKQIIYGAIWTDKGLVYVAKMNEKGELELL